MSKTHKVKKQRWKREGHRSILQAKTSKVDPPSNRLFSCGFCRASEVY